MKSLWLADYKAKARPKLNGTMETDTAIIGGGIAGILCAYFLSKRGIDCVVLEAKEIGGGNTQNTTAKITAQHALIYAQIAQTYSLAAAKEYLGANQDAVGLFRSLCQDIDCDFENKTAYVYSKDNRKKLEAELKVYRQMGVDMAFLETAPLPIKTVGALGMPEQAQFHPMKFLGALAEGLNIFENTLVKEIKPGKVMTENGSVITKNIILATHYPMVNIPGLYFMKLYQNRSYALALKGAPDPDGMFIDEKEGGLSFRSYKDYVIFGGCGHKTGEKGGGWNALRRTAKSIYPNAQEEYYWAAQDCISLDSMPYIGRHRKNSRELFVTTGFNKWGMTGAMAAAQLLSELICEGKAKYETLFSPSRSMLNPQLFSNIGSSALGLLSFGKRCSHMGCALKWNPQEHTWDCPCHGSRFDKKGNVIDNPAKRGIHIE